MAAAGVSRAIHDEREANRIVEWFGDTIPLQVAERVRIMDAFFQGDGRTVTFVDRRHEREREIIYRGPGVRAAYGRSLPMGACDYAYVKLLPGASGPGTGHVGSGMRLYLGERFFHTSSNLVDRAATIYHELAHKLLGIPDHVYMPGPCRTLARTSAQTAFDNADNWCYYATSFIYSWP